MSTVDYNPVFSGLHAGLPFDTIYSTAVSAMKIGDFTMRGYSKSKITKDELTDKWTIQMTSDPKKHATTNGTLPPFGNQIYRLSDDIGGGWVTLNLDACIESSEFNCIDGGCISIEHRCDSTLDCADGSDESDCQIMEIPPTYLKHVPAGVMYSKTNIYEHVKIDL